MVAMIMMLMMTIAWNGSLNDVELKFKYKISFTKTRNKLINLRNNILNLIPSIQFDNLIHN